MEMGHARILRLSINCLENHKPPFLPRTLLVAYQNGSRAVTCSLKMLTSDSDMLLLPL